MKRQSRARELKSQVRLQCWGPVGMREAIAAAADAAWEKPAETMKRYLREGLERDLAKRPVGSKAPPK